MTRGEPAQPPNVSDADTVAYFESHVPEYSSGRLELTAEILRRMAGPEDVLIDLGCGVGNTLAYLQEETPLTRFAALDVSQNCLDKTVEPDSADHVTCHARADVHAAANAPVGDVQLVQTFVELRCVGPRHVESEKPGIDAGRP